MGDRVLLNTTRETKRYFDLYPVSFEKTWYVFRPVTISSPPFFFVLSVEVGVPEGYRPLGLDFYFVGPSFPTTPMSVSETEGSRTRLSRVLLLLDLQGRTVDNRPETLSGARGPVTNRPSIGIALRLTVTTMETTTTLVSVTLGSDDHVRTMVDRPRLGTRPRDPSLPSTTVPLAIFFPPKKFQSNGKKDDLL